MRISCETCGQVQPPSWQPGDLCGHCGGVVRREHRCFWCVELTPEGNFCRHCGATQVPDEQYGAGRWLKHLGSDQFSIPERLATLPAAQVEHFTRLYQRHAAVAERHVDDLAFAESFARQRGWARALEAELLPRLPLPEPELAALTLPPRRGTTEAEQLADIRDASPFADTRLLAALARLRLWQTQDALTRGDLAPDLGVLLAGPPPIGALGMEYGLTLSHWRLTTAPAGLSFQRDTALGLKLASERFPLEVAVNRALLRMASDGKPQEIPAAALAAEDPDLAFAAALATQEPEPLRAALRVPARAAAAAYSLTRRQVSFDLLPLLPAFGFEEISRLFYIISWQQRPRPDLRPVLQLMLTGQYGSLCVTYARDLLVLDLHPGDALRLLRAFPDATFASKLLASPALTPAQTVEVCRELVALNLFDPQKVPPLATLIEADALPADFIPSTFATAGLTYLWGLRTLAYRQLKTQTISTIAPLADFLRRLRWQVGAPLEQRGWASSLLSYWYGGNTEAGRPELGFTAAAAAPYFPTYQAFIEEFAYGLEHAEELQQMEMGHHFVRPLLQVRDVTDPTLVAAPLAALPPALFDRLLTNLLAFITPQSDTYAVHGTLHLLNLLRHYAPWQATMQAHLEAQRGGYYDYEVQQLLAGNLEVKLPTPESPPPAEPPVTPLADELPPTTPIAYSPFAFPGPLGELLLFTLAELQPEAGQLPALPTAGSGSSLQLLYPTGRYQTPAALQQQLTRYQVALWRSAGEQLWALSSRTATVLLPAYQGPETPLDFVTFLPAKGGGYLALYAGQLAFYDAYQSPVLKQLLAEILARTAASVNYLQSHDC